MSAERWGVRAALPCLCLLLGCAPRDAGFSEVAGATEARTGRATEWTRRQEDDRRAAELTRSLVAREVTLDSAIRIALVNNRHLQATFERLGIARGRFIQAAVPENPIFGAELRFPPAGVSFEGAVLQDFLSVALIPLRRDVTGYELEATKSLVTREVVHLVGDVKRAFFAYQASKQLVSMFEQVLQATKASYMTSMRLREAGNMRQLDVFRERALFEETKVQLNAAVEVMVGRREQLNALLGLWGARTAWSTPERLADVPGLEVTATPAAPPPPPSEGVPAVTRSEVPTEMPGEQEPPDAPGGPLQRAQRLAGPPSKEDVAIAAERVHGEPELADTEAARVGGRPEPSAERFAAVERTAVARSLELAALRSLIEAQAARVKLRTIREIFPFLNAGVTAERGAESGDWGFGPAARIPLPLWDFAQGTNPAEKSALRNRLEDYAAFAVDVRATARAAETRMQTSRSRAVYYRDVIMPLHAALVAEGQLQFNAMQITPFELLLLKRRQIAAASAYIAALLEHWLARSDLEELLDGSMPAGVVPHGLGVFGGGMGLPLALPAQPAQPARPAGMPGGGP